MLKKIFAFLLFFVIVTGQSSAIKISPTKTNLKLIQGETKCINIWILPEKNYSVYSSWSLDGEGQLEKYNLSFEEVNIKIAYEYLSEGKYEFCFTPRYGGNFSGIIYFYDNENMVEIGSWINLEVKGEKFTEKIGLLTGNIISDYKNNKVNFLLAVCLILLVLVLFFLIKISDFKRKN